MLIKEFVLEIEKTYKKYFKDSRINVDFSTNLYSSIMITCYIAKDGSDVYNGILENDILSIRFSIDTEHGAFNKDITEDSEIPNNLVLVNDHNMYLIKPQYKHYAYGSRKISFRKTRGDHTKIIKTLDRFFKKLHISLVDDLEQGYIPNNYIELLKTKL